MGHAELLVGIEMGMSSCRPPAAQGVDELEAALATANRLTSR
ncbi:hypothetical protein [Microbispora sp. H10836]|nr:hypothetical protein [Microbispora sp. H10836]